MFRGLAYRFVAENAWAKEEYGVGLAYMMQARVTERDKPTDGDAWARVCLLGILLGGFELLVCR